ADEGEILGPRDVEENLQAHLLREVQEPPRREVVNADAVGPHLDDLIEILAGVGGAGEWLALGVGRERAVGDAFDVKFVCPEPEEFSVPPHAVGYGLGAALPTRVNGGRGFSG